MDLAMCLIEPYLQSKYKEHCEIYVSSFFIKLSHIFKRDLVILLALGVHCKKLI